jgi:hypothetical protein
MPIKSSAQIVEELGSIISKTFHAKREIRHHNHALGKIFLHACLFSQAIED